jgi:hypothetical protein
MMRELPTPNSIPSEMMSTMMRVLKSPCAGKPGIFASVNMPATAMRKTSAGKAMNASTSRWASMSMRPPK